MAFDIYDALTKHADDAVVQVIELTKHVISISVSVPSCGDSVWLIRSADVIHLDMSPQMILGHIEFGNLSLLPPSYAERRDFDYGGEETEYRVIHFVDILDKHAYLVLHGKEEIVPEKAC
jgi:hypothetical protein